MAEFDFDAAYEKARQDQLRRTALPDQKLKWPIRHARGSGRIINRIQHQRSQHWMAEKMDKAIEKDFWERAEKRVGMRT